MKRYLCINEDFSLEQTDDVEVLHEWIEYGCMLVDTQEGKSYTYSEEENTAGTWDDINEGKIGEDVNG